MIVAVAQRAPQCPSKDSGVTCEIVTEGKSHDPVTEYDPVTGVQCQQVHIEAHKRF